MSTSVEEFTDKHGNGAEKDLAKVFREMRQPKKPGGSADTGASAMAGRKRKSAMLRGGDDHVRSKAQTIRADKTSQFVRRMSTRKILLGQQAAADANGNATGGIANSGPP